MRPVLHEDVTSAARALLLVRADRRQALCKRFVAQADMAEAYVQQTGRLHADYGNGTLMAAARSYPLADEPTFDDLEYCHCVVTVLMALIDHGDDAA
ncbi:hypothetical protein EBB79_12145 [Parasedimentitalea marina]|uniref:DUF7742 domain-containing protein n=1 Tax=Parasedimentitalea marina TaxID=2483033 RepID=A0A3T0N3J2_9RHOB|nr:hypothetical protein [Parasedimentitalea marina]AZV78552.1 hypothetical protein EBB79_12145 [Parasedimentitalea marina]